MTDLRPGQIVWVDVDTTVGREQGGRRPYVVVSSEDYLDLVVALFIAAPLTTTDRAWPNHVRAVGQTGLKKRVVDHDGASSHALSGSHLRRGRAGVTALPDAGA